MVSVQTFVDFIKRKDVGRIKFAIREANFDLDSTDQDGRTVLHYAVEHGAEHNDLQMTRLLLSYGADVNIRDETIHKETPLHVAMRMEHVETLKLLLESSSFDVVKCDTFPRKRILPHFQTSSAEARCDLNDDENKVDHVFDDVMTNSGVSTTGSASTMDTQKTCGYTTDQHNSACRQGSVFLSVRQNARHFVDGRSMEQLDHEVETWRSTNANVLPVDDVIIVQDECIGLLPLAEIIRRTSPRSSTLPVADGSPQENRSTSSLPASPVTGLYVVDCRLDIDDDEPMMGQCVAGTSSLPAPSGGPSMQLFDALINLRSLVLSNTRLRQLPRGVATCLTTLEVLKVDGNRFEDLPAEMERLSHLKILCLDRQRPRMRTLPAVIARLANLQVLSISNNRIEDISLVTSLRSLRTLRADRNHISRLPNGLATLRDLTVLDVSHNRIETIPACLADLVQRLYRFDYYNVRMQPRRCPPRDRRQLVGHLELEQLLSISRPTSVRDLTVAVVGERRCGKTTLADALRRSIAVSGLSGSGSDFRSTGSIPDALLCGDGPPGVPSDHVDAVCTSTYVTSTSSTFMPSSSSSSWCWMNVIELSCGGHLDSYVRGLDVDVFLLTFDLTALHATSSGHHHNGGLALASRHATRLHMWLQALYEVAPDTPVILVATRADMVRSSSGAAYNDIWSTVEALLETGRTHHYRHFPPPVELLTNSFVAAPQPPESVELELSETIPPPPEFQNVNNNKPTLSVPTGRSNCMLCNSNYNGRELGGHGLATRRLYSKSRVGGLGYVEVPQLSPIVTGGATAANGHAAFAAGAQYDDAIPGCGPAAMHSSAYRSIVSAGSRFPHVLGYFETDGRIRKDCKSGLHHSVEKLRESIVRMTSSPPLYKQSGGGHAVREQYQNSRQAAGVGDQPSSVQCGEPEVAPTGSGYRIPRSWVSMLKSLADVVRHRGSGSTTSWFPPGPTPSPVQFVVVDDLKALARKCDIPLSQVPHALNYFHRRGKLVYFGPGSSGTGTTCALPSSDELLVRLAVLDSSWFVNQVGRVLSGRLPSRCSIEELIKSVADRQVDAWLRTKLQQVEGDSTMSRDPRSSTARGQPGAADDVIDSPTGRWMLAALERLELVVSLDDLTRQTSGSSSLVDLRHRQLLIPRLLEYGNPSHDVWPDNPEWEERQITCDFGVRTLRPGMFIDFLVRLNGSEGRRQLRIVPDPVPVFLSHHAVFFAGVDQGGCTDCYNVRRRMRARQPRSASSHMVSCDGTRNDIINMAAVPPAADGGEDESLHKVHVMLHNRMDAIRVQVRGTSPCCTMKAVLGFLELYLHDGPEDEPPSDGGTAGANAPGTGCGYGGADTNSLDGASFSSRTTTTSTSCYGGPVMGGIAGGFGGNGGGSPSGFGGLAAQTARHGGSDASLGSLFPPPPPPLSFGCSGAPPTVDESFSSSATTGDDPRDLFLLCPKCVLLRHAHPGRIAYHCVSPPKRRATAAVCRKWHNLGSWTRATTGDYRFSSVVEVPPSAAMTILPDYEHPRLVLVLPPGQRLSHTDWYMFGRTRFLDGFEVHFLCEYTGYWHMTDDVGFWLGSCPPQSSSATPATGGKRPVSSGATMGPSDGAAGRGTASGAGTCSGSAGGANQVPVLLNLALSLVQIVQGIPEHSNNCRLVAPVVAALLKTYEYLRVVDAHAQPDTYAWLTKNKDRVVAMLTKVLAAASDGGMADLYFRVNNPLNAHAVFQSPSVANRQLLARHLRIDSSSGRFGALRPIYVEREIRWVCDVHYEELRSAAT